MNIESQKVEWESLHFTRRTLIRRLAALSLGACVPSAMGCHWQTQERRYFVKHAFEWNPQGVFRDIAFAIADTSLGPAIDYLDANCPRCVIATRTFSYAAELGSVFLVTCPKCAVSLRASVAVSRVLVRTVKSNAIKRGIGMLASRGGYWINIVAPTVIREGKIAAGRSAACYEISGREPQGLFDREIPAVPRSISYFTEILGATKTTRVVHTWIRDGRVTDQIELKVDSPKWRTWTMKRNLAPGAWILTTQASNGDYLDLREFHIAE